MKKILAIILSLATAVLAAVGLSACGNNVSEGENNNPPQQSQDNNTNNSDDKNDQSTQQPSDEGSIADDIHHSGDEELEFEDPINYTATEPWFSTAEYRENYANKERIKTLYTYQELANYYAGNMKGEKLYLLYSDTNPTVNNYGGPYRFYYIYFNEDTEQYLLLEYFTVYEESLGCPVTSTGRKVSVEMWMYIKPVYDYDGNGFSMEFGQYADVDSVDYKYGGKLSTFINFYNNEECFATCYFNGKVPITEEWFENYFKENMVWGDSL